MTQAFGQENLLPQFTITWIRSADNQRIGKIQTAEGAWIITLGVTAKDLRFETVSYSNLISYAEDYRKRQQAGIWAIVPGRSDGEAGPRDARHIHDQPRSIFTLDLDGLEPDESSGPLDSPQAFAGAAFDAAIARLPEPFRDADCLVLATSATGLARNSKNQAAKGRAWFRLTFLLSRPITLMEMKALAAKLRLLPGLGCIDLALYSPAGFEFVARPVFLQRDPIENPVLQSVFDDGRKAVDVDALYAVLDLKTVEAKEIHDREPAQRALEVAPSVRTALVRQGVAAIANTLDRNEWVWMAHAIDGATDGDPQAETIFLKFSQRRKDGMNDPAENARVWETRGEGRAGYGFIMQQLETQGTLKAAAALEAIRAAQVAAMFTVIAEPQRSGLILLNAANLKPEPVDWLWKDWLQAAAINILAGQSTAGKSTVALKLCAIITIGGLWPDGTQARQGHTLFWSGEDGIEDTLLPRFLASGGDPNFMHFVGGLERGGKKRPFEPARDMPELMRAIQRLDNVRMAVLDPVAVVVTGDSHKNTESRVGLQPFADLCLHTRACGFGVHHFTKNTVGGDPLDRVSGSLAFHALPRSVLVAARNRNAGPDAPRALIRAKISNGSDQDGFEYNLERVPLENYPKITAQRAAWGNPVFGTAREILANFELQKEKKEMKGMQAIRFLEEALKDGPKEAAMVIGESIKAGVSEWALKQGKQALGVVAEKKGFQGVWIWALPEVAY